MRRCLNSPRGVSLSRRHGDISTEPDPRRSCEGGDPTECRVEAEALSSCQPFHIPSGRSTQSKLQRPADPNMSAPQEGPEDTYWYCPECGDGPYGSWTMVCANCAYKKS
ncbi:hypothetical protein BU26DRAFT_512624 [Trematosphaeria pertusa]|uniref:Uncharacterized protein n=1 Tax=Trematosphaeria pertusa TaxID=390896 RepID=A0A6A6J011_9PLEO|nr:uncharacterized protein BU26DRAFT_512624 [Trematosphaeria pertusa]KAF2255657.1 hypothetical protein BU26DRAFT_512624 [Trematosphaeria pertusa]